MTLTMANSGLPMLMFAWPILILALIPIVLIEAGIYRFRLGIPFRRSALGSLGANLLSTLLGVPVTWIALVVVQLVAAVVVQMVTDGAGSAQGPGLYAVTWQAPWLYPYENSLHWMIPAAGLVLCVPFLLTSVLIEFLFLRRIWTQTTAQKIHRTCWLANGTTYACIAAFWGSLFIYALSQPMPEAQQSPGSDHGHETTG